MSRKLRHHASLVLNVVLTVMAVALALHKSEYAPATSAREASPEKTTIETPVFTTKPDLRRYTDSASASDRLRGLIDQLRAAGVPNDVLARLAQADLDERWEARFWEESRGLSPDKVSALQLEHDMGKDAQMRAALGEEGFKQWDSTNMLKEAMSGKTQLTTSEADAIYDFKKKLQQRQLELEQAGVNGTMDEAQITDASDKAYSEFNQQMKSLLGDERYAQSQGLDAGTAAANLKQDLASVSPSDTQFQDLLKAQQQLNDARSALDPSSPDYAAQLQALDDARNQEYQSVLGTNAFNTLQKQQDNGYTQMKKYENIWGLDDNKVDGVYNAIQYYQKTAQDYQAQAQASEAQGQSVDWGVVNKNLQQFAQQTQQSLQNYLGQDTFNKMQRNGIFQFNQ